MLKAALVLAHRLHGCAALAWELAQACRRVGSHFLTRARSQIKVRTLRRLPDGSQIVRGPVRQKGQPQGIGYWLELREIRVTLRRPGFRPPRAATVYQFVGPAPSTGLGTGGVVCATLGTGVVLSATETAVAQH